MIDRALSAHEAVAILVQENYVLVTGATVVCDVIDFASNSVLTTLTLTETPSSSGYYKAASDVDPVGLGATLGTVHLYRFRQTAPVTRTLALSGVAYRTLETEAEAVAALPAAVWNLSLSSYTNRTLAGGALIALRKLGFNRLEEAPGNPGTLTLYQDDAATTFVTYQIRDYQGNALGATVGQAARRAAAA